MKRSGNVGLVLMGGAAFAATFAGGMAYFAWQKPSHAAQPQTAARRRPARRAPTARRIASRSGAALPTTSFRACPRLVVRRGATARSRDAQTAALDEQLALSRAVRRRAAGAPSAAASDRPRAAARIRVSAGG